MNVLCYGTIIFCLAFFLHILIWKIHIPKRQIKGLLQIFFGSLIASFIILRMASALSIFEYIHIVLFFISLTLAYITTYSAMEVDSPSLLIALNIAKGGPEGLDKEKFEQLMIDDFLVKPRINDLVTDGMVYLDENEYKLTEVGILCARLFIFYRGLLHAPKGG